MAWAALVNTKDRIDEFFTAPVAGLAFRDYPMERGETCQTRGPIIPTKFKQHISNQPMLTALRQLILQQNQLSPNFKLMLKNTEESYILNIETGWVNSKKGSLALIFLFYFLNINSTIGIDY